MGKPFDPQWDPIRRSLGYTLRLARRVNLASMVPRKELASSGYCLAHASKSAAEYLVYLPEGGRVTVDLSQSAGEMKLAWLNPADGTVKHGSTARGGARREFLSPLAQGDAVLVIRGV